MKCMFFALLCAISMPPIHLQAMASRIASSARPAVITSLRRSTALVTKHHNVLQQPMRTFHASRQLHCDPFLDVLAIAFWGTGQIIKGISAVLVCAGGSYLVYRIVKSLTSLDDAHKLLQAIENNDLSQLTELASASKGTLYGKAEDGTTFSPLSYAIEHHHNEAALILIRAGYNIINCDGAGNSAYACARKVGNDPLVKILDEILA